MKDIAVLLAASGFFAGAGGEPGPLPEPDSCILGHYRKGAVAIQEGDPCDSVGIVLRGALAVLQISPGGETIRIQTLRAGDSFGDAQLFTTSPAYLYTLAATHETDVLYVPFREISALMDRSPAFCRNFIRHLSLRVQAFQRKIRILSQKDVRSRLVIYLAGEAERQGGTVFRLKRQRTEIAEIIGVARPSVPREMRRMAEDGLIAVDGKTVTLLKPRVFSLKG